MLTKRIFSLFLIIPFLTSMPVVTQEKRAVASEIVESRAIDKRAEVLEAYLARHNSPMRYQAQNFVDAADQYNLDWKFVAAVAGNESTFGKFIPGGHQPGYTSYNAWGWGVYGTQAIHFDSWKDGIFTVSKGLRENYFNKGLTDPYSINKVYAASPHWGKNVTFFLNDIAKFDAQYRTREPMKEASQFLPKTAGQSGTLALKIN